MNKINSAAIIECCYCEERPATMAIAGENGDIELCDECLRALFYKAFNDPPPDHTSH